MSSRETLIPWLPTRFAEGLGDWALGVGLCECVWMCGCLCESMSICECVFMEKYVCLYVMYVYVNVCRVCAYEYVWLCVCICECVCVCAHTRMCVWRHKILRRNPLPPPLTVFPTQCSVVTAPHDFNSPSPSPHHPNKSIFHVQTTCFWLPLPTVFAVSRLLL